MISDGELMELFDRVAGEFHGQSDDLTQMIGMVVLGRLYGWRVARLVTPSKVWARSVKILGCDPKALMPERGKYAYKSLALSVADRLGGYWDMVRGSALNITGPEKKVLQ